MGDTPYEPIFRALRDSQYGGWISVEVFDYSPGAEKIATDSMNYMRKIEEIVST
jgi:sugar phosphate isomerase/epimerase